MDSFGNQLYTTSHRSLKVWDVNVEMSIAQISDISAHQGAIKCVTANQNISNDGGAIFATGGDKNDKTICLWDMTTLTNMTTLKGHKGEIRAIEFSKDGKYLFSAGQGGMLVWDLRKTAS